MAVLTDTRRHADLREAELAQIAGLILAQLARRRPARRGLAGLLDRFDRKVLDLRASLSKFERQFRSEGGERSKDRAEIEEKRHFKRLRQRLHAAARISDALRLVQKGAEWPLYPHLPPRHDLTGSRIAALDGALMTLHRMVNPAPQSQVAGDLGCYPDIPFNAAGFITHAHAALRVALALRPGRGLRFLDVGCGGGMKVLLASGLFAQAEGFDYDPAYVEAAAGAFHRMGAARCAAFHANALTFADYDRYDVIYFFQPMADPDSLRALEDRVIAGARPGTVIMAPYQRFHARRADLGCARIEDAVYVTGIVAEEAGALAQEARRIGPDILPPDRHILPAAPDWLRDLWRAAADNGYLPD
ncbi:methyltransferase domain-containing protein [Szabonella alba]|uniref:Methyltransferase domain-containing protein n=1 Tax=Szabonella alba TaxID=2804194 RepID=A0A8K0Y1A2_9RHOB|nr:methyltransferase domain-containing protein [Szabonella alba]MBL4919095.1 methyltransferase domain-containing protein [Szabonella alba]